MGFNKIFQNGNQIVVANHSFTAAVDHFGLDLAVLKNQSGGKTRTVLVGHAVSVAVDHVIEIVYHGLGQHERLLAVGQIQGLGGIGDRLAGNGLRDKAVHIHENIVIDVELIQNPLKFVNGDKIAVILSAELPVGECPVRIRNQHMEGQIRNLIGVIVRNQRGFLLLVLGQTNFNFRVVALVAGEALQQGDGTVIVVALGQSGSCVNEILRFLLLTLGLIHSGFGGFDAGLVVQPDVGNEADNGTNHKNHNQQRGSTENEHGQRFIFETTHGADRLPTLPANRPLRFGIGFRLICGRFRFLHGKGAGRPHLLGKIRIECVLTDILIGKAAFQGHILILQIVDRLRTVIEIGFIFRGKIGSFLTELRSEQGVQIEFVAFVLLCGGIII